ncbi:MAG: hypothetical protein F6K36_29765 [Symploca sp. SIO3C6]|nr:hypothetical protein [Symploca sp. SIO3C6]
MTAHNHHSNPQTPLLNPHDIIKKMVDLRVQISLLQQQVDDLQDNFFAACFALNQDTITLKQATIRRQLSRGKWNYPSNITEQDLLIKALKDQFKQDNEPISGRDITWVIRLLKRPS